MVTYRKRLGLTQEDLAHRTGLSVRTIRGVESGRVRVPRQASVRLLATAFGLRGPERDRFLGPAGAASNGVLPAQLPADVAGFTGREVELSRLDTLMDTATEPAVVISAVSGTAGVGKTALAIRWAHRARARFPDGQLYVDLRGYDRDQPMTAAAALAMFLQAMGLSGSDIPADVDERAARYRTELAGRHMLVVLDNAGTVEQVRPLLPGTGSSAVLVTSRDSMAGLVARHGAHRLDLDLLSPAEAVALLRRLIGDRVTAEPDVAAALADQCARLPLALRVAAELAISRPAIPLADLSADLAEQGSRLDLLDAGGDPRTAVSAVFSWSMRHLPPRASRLFRLLGLHPGPDADAHAAAALAGTSLPETRRTLDLLARAHLIRPVDPDGYGMHDLLRTFAQGRNAGPAADDARAALERLFDYYLGTAAAAIDRLYPAEAHRRARVTPPTTPTPDLTDPDAARRWLDSQRHRLVAVAGYTATHGWGRYTAGLSTMLFRYLDGGHYTDALAIHGHARDVARDAGDQIGHAQALLGLGAVRLRLGSYGTAFDHHRQALALFRRAGDRVGQARAMANLSQVEERLGRYQRAAEHHERALVLFQEAGDRHGEAYALNFLGVIALRSGRHDPAAELHEQALVLFRQTGDLTGEAYALNNLGVVEEARGRLGPAAEHLQHALALFRRLGNRSGEAWALGSLGNVHTRLGQPHQAAEYQQRALTLFREIGDHASAAWVLNGIGEAVHAAGQPDDALAHHTAALAAATDTGARHLQARAHAGLGQAHRTLGSPTRARHHLERALILHTDLGSPDVDDIRARLDSLDRG